MSQEQTILAHLRAGNALTPAGAYALCGTLEVAVTAAAADALESDAVEPVVLLSPACASYDQFPNFEVRGDAFRDLVKALVVKYQLT